MSGWRLLPVFIIVMFVLLFFVQFFFFVRVTSYIKATRKPKWARNATYTIFALFNLPLIVLLLWRPHFTYFPEWFMYIGVYSFYVWHFTLLILLLVYLLFKILQSPFSLSRWLINKMKRPDKLKKNTSTS